MKLYFLYVTFFLYLASFILFLSYIECVHIVLYNLFLLLLCIHVQTLLNDVLIIMQSCMYIQLILHSIYQFSYSLCWYIEE